MEALYPFLYAGTSDLSEVLAQVRASTVAKTEEIAELRRTVAARETARLANCAEDMAARVTAGRLRGGQDGRGRQHRLPVRGAVLVGAPHSGSADDHVPRPVGAHPRFAGPTPWESQSGADMRGRMLVAGVGNIFLGDDGFGVEAAKRLAGAGLPSSVQWAHYAISGMHLAYDLSDGYAPAILVDTAHRGGATV